MIATINCTHCTYLQRDGQAECLPAKEWRDWLRLSGWLDIMTKWSVVSDLTRLLNSNTFNDTEIPYALNGITHRLCICWRGCSEPSESTRCFEGLDLQWSSPDRTGTRTPCSRSQTIPAKTHMMHSWPCHIRLYSNRVQTSAKASTSTKSDQAFKSGFAD